MSFSTAKRDQPKPQPTETSAAETPEPAEATPPAGLDLDTLMTVDGAKEAAIYYGTHYGGYIALAIVIGFLSYLTYRTSQNNQNTGENQPSVFKKLSTSLSFQMKEDTRPVFPQLPWTRLKVFLLGAIPLILILAWPLNWNIPIAVIVIVLGAACWKRYSDVQLAREHALNQIFEISREKLKYKGSADLVKDQYIQISEWRDMVIPSTVTIMYPSSTPVAKDEFRHDFEMHLTSQAIAGVVWDFEWEYPNNRVIVTAQPPLPTMAYLPFPTIGEFEWDTLPLGVGINGETLYWKVGSCPHAVVAGKSGSGKSVLQRNILIHCLQSPNWNVILVDPKRVELSMYKDADAVVKYAVAEDTMNEALEFALEEMANRYTLMEREGVAFYRKLSNHPNALLVMIDEAASLLLETGDREIDTLKKRNKVIVGRLAREGRAAGVHLVLATQRPDAKWLGGDTRETIEGRGAMGNMSSSASLMILNNVMATRTPGIKGRGIWFDGNDYHPMQSYFFDDSDVPPAIPYCNGLRDGSINPEELRTQLYPDVDGDGKPDSAEPSFGGGTGGVFGRIKTWFKQQADKNGGDDDGREDADDGNAFDLKGWISSRRAPKQENADVSLMPAAVTAQERPEALPAIRDAVEVDEEADDDWTWSSVESADDVDPFLEEMMGGQNQRSTNTPVIQKPPATQTPKEPGRSEGLSDADIASLDKLLREMKEDGP